MFCKIVAYVFENSGNLYSGKDANIKDCLEL